MLDSKILSPRMANSPKITINIFENVEFARIFKKLCTWFKNVESFTLAGMMWSSEI